jgi:threonyl-tRNA synthetase
VQVVVIPIAERHVEYANKLAAMLRGSAAGSDSAELCSAGRAGAPVPTQPLPLLSVRVEVDARNEKMNAKIREHAMQKVPFMLVVGDKEAEAAKVNVRTRGKEKTEDMSAEEFGEKVRNVIASRASSL